MARCSAVVGCSCTVARREGAAAVASIQLQEEQGDTSDLDIRCIEVSQRDTVDSRDCDRQRYVQKETNVAVCRAADQGETTRKVTWLLGIKTVNVCAACDFLASSIRLSASTIAALIAPKFAA